MTMTDPLGDMLTRIRNGQRAGASSILSPASNLRTNVLEVLKECDQGSDACRVHVLDRRKVQNEEYGPIVAHALAQYLDQALCLRARELAGHHRNLHEVIGLLDLKVGCQHAGMSRCGPASSSDRTSGSLFKTGKF